MPVNIAKLIFKKYIKYHYRQQYFCIYKASEYLQSEVREIFYQFFTNKHCRLSIGNLPFALISLQINTIYKNYQAINKYEVASYDRGFRHLQTLM